VQTAGPGLAALRPLHARLLHPDRLLHRPDDVAPARAPADPRPRRARLGLALDVEMLTVGPIAENAFLVRPEGDDELIVVDPGEEPERLLAAIGASGAKVAAILLTHTHFDPVGAVAPLARATGAPVYVPELEKAVLADIMSFVP